MSTRTFALIFGILFLVIGIAGFVPGLVTDMTPGAEVAPGSPDAAPAAATMASHGYLLGLFPVNALHNLFHVAWGVFGLAAYGGMTGVRLYARATAIVYGVLTVLGLVPGLSTLFGLLPLYGHDVWLHAVLALVAAYFGFARPADAEVVGSADAARTPLGSGRRG